MWDEKFWAEKVIKTIDDTKCPMLLHDEEKEVTRKALELFVETINKREIACEGD